MDLQSIKERVARATPGPWKSARGCVLFARKGPSSYGDYESPYGFSVSGENMTAAGYLPNDEADATSEFIANAPTDINALVAEVETLRAAALDALDLLQSVEIQSVPVRGKANTIKRLRQATA